jgi:hypothetical protein
MIYYQVDIFFRNVVIEENPDGHHRGSAGGDRCVHEDDSEVFDVFRETQIVQLGLTSIGARLKQTILFNYLTVLIRSSTQRIP